MLLRLKLLVFCVCLWMKAACVIGDTQRGVWGSRRILHNESLKWPSEIPVTSPSASPAGCTHFSFKIRSTHNTLLPGSITHWHANNKWHACRELRVCFGPSSLASSHKMGSSGTKAKDCWVSLSTHGVQTDGKRREKDQTFLSIYSQEDMVVML